MSLKLLVVAVPAAFVLLSNAPANAAQSLPDVGFMACVSDKWDEKEVEKGHKLVDFAGRCISIPTNAADPKSAGDCVGKYEYMPDESWKGSGTCTYKFKDGDTIDDSWEEGSALKEAYTYKYTGGTGKYKGATGGGTYFYENITDTLAGGTFKGTIELP
jgi:hypothetical protein